MFVHFFAHIGRPYEEVARALLDSPERWVPSVIEDAYESGDKVRARVGFGKTDRLTKEVFVSVGEYRQMPGRTVLPIRVEAGPVGLFPRLDADLEVAPVGGETTQLTLNGSYRPPLGAAGAFLDRALLHRVAEAVVKNFVDRVATILSGATLSEGEPIEGTGT